MFVHHPHSVYYCVHWSYRINKMVYILRCFGRSNLLIVCNNHLYKFYPFISLLTLAYKLQIAWGRFRNIVTCSSAVRNRYILYICWADRVQLYIMYGTYINIRQIQYNCTKCTVHTSILDRYCTTVQNVRYIHQY